jgi:hypothetical protein
MQGHKGFAHVPGKRHPCHSVPDLLRLGVLFGIYPLRVVGLVVFVIWVELLADRGACSL